MSENRKFQLGTIGALSLSVVSSVSIVICNKALISTLGFTFGQLLNTASSFFLFSYIYPLIILPLVSIPDLLDSPSFYFTWDVLLLLIPHHNWGLPYSQLFLFFSAEFWISNAIKYNFLSLFSFFYDWFILSSLRTVHHNKRLNWKYYGAEYLFQFQSRIVRTLVVKLHVELTVNCCCLVC